MTNKISSKIVGYKVMTEKSDTSSISDPGVAPSKESAQSEDKVVYMHESVQRPDMLVGSTYKVKTPVSEHAMYITINDMVLNEGTEYEKRRPFEVFINSKNMDNFQWVVALTRLISAVFRKGGDATFLVEELKAVFDPKGGYWKKGGIFMPSTVAEIGFVIEKHMQMLGMIKTDGLDEHQKAFIEKKQAEIKAQQAQSSTEADSDYPENASLCTKCSTKAAILMDGCLTCLSCGDSKCG